MLLNDGDLLFTVRPVLKPDISVQPKIDLIRKAEEQKKVMVNLIDKDLETDSIKVISMACPLLSKRQEEPQKVLGTILWEIDFEAGFEYSIIPGSFNANRIPFLDIRHSKKKGNVDLYQYYRYANNPHPILKGIDENEDYL